MSFNWPSRIFDAKYPFTCACCQEQFPAGTPAYYDSHSRLRNGEPEHIWPGDASQGDVGGREPGYRVPDTMPHGKTAADRCDRCFMVHSPGQDGCE